MYRSGSWEPEQSEGQSQTQLPGDLAPAQSPLQTSGSPDHTQSWGGAGKLALPLGKGGGCLCRILKEEELPFVGDRNARKKSLW